MSMISNLEAISPFVSHQPIRDEGTTQSGSKSEYLKKEKNIYENKLAKLGEVSFFLLNFPDFLLFLTIVL